MLALVIPGSLKTTGEMEETDAVYPGKRASADESASASKFNFRPPQPRTTLLLQLATCCLGRCLARIYQSSRKLQNVATDGGPERAKRE